MDFQTLFGEMNEVQYQIISLLNQKYTQLGFKFVSKHKGDFRANEVVVPTASKLIHIFKHTGLIFKPEVWKHFLHVQKFLLENFANGRCSHK
ncbi:hypothetical protein VP01_3013g1 [Puccinia sorghi]|uniref:Uncharacterized protein n=1 Tax=Puccinia sorghi TaxID=27349 RepID=A0A0L6V0B3_9BASI|nr:hypothetical protein VP01_3013g1 [Puccinia sorghi]